MRQRSRRKGEEEYYEDSWPAGGSSASSNTTLQPRRPGEAKKLQANQRANAEDEGEPAVECGDEEETNFMQLGVTTIWQHGTQEGGVVEGYDQLSDGECSSAPVGSVGRCNVQISWEELLVAICRMQGAVPLLGEQIAHVHNVDSQVSGFTRARKVYWQHSLSSDRIMQHSGK